MPVHKSVLKRARQNEKRRLRNIAVKSTIKTYSKKVNEAIAKKDIEAAKEALKKAIKVIDKAVTKGVIHKNNAARRKSRLTIKLNNLLAA
jgi:small subunit ribosomal protein S20